MGIAASGTNRMTGVQKDPDMYSRRMYGGSRDASAEEAKRATDRATQWDERYSRQMGPSIDYTAAQQDRARSQGSRGEQLYGQGLARDMAQGGGPSAATAQNAADLDAVALQQAQSAAGGSMRAAQQGGAQAMGQAGTADGRGRAAETAAGRTAYLGGAAGMRQDDLGQAGMDLGRQSALAEMAARQRALADQQNAFYEKLGYGGRTANMDAEHAGNELALQDYAIRGQAELANEDRVMGQAADAAQAMGTVMQFASDRRLKRDVEPMGSRRYGGK